VGDRKGEEVEGPKAGNPEILGEISVPVPRCPPVSNNSCSVE